MVCDVNGKTSFLFREVYPSTVFEVVVQTHTHILVCRAVSLRRTVNDRRGDGVIDVYVQGLRPDSLF